MGEVYAQYILTSVKESIPFYRSSNPKISVYSDVLLRNRAALHQRPCLLLTVKLLHILVPPAHHGVVSFYLNRKK